MMRILISFVFTFILNYGIGQSFFYSDTISVPPFYGVSDIGLFNSDICINSGSSPFNPFFFSDMTMHPNGTLYAFGYHVFTPGLRQMCFITWPIVGIGNLSQYYQDSIQGLACDQNGLIYGAGDGLSIYDVGTDNFTYLGDFPSGIKCAGDIVFYQGDLLMTTTSNELVLVNVVNPANSIVLFQFLANTPLIHGLFTKYVNCDSSELYGIAPTEGLTTIFRIDIVNESLVDICNNNIYMYGAASLDQFTPPPCQLSVDLDFDDSSEATGFDFNSDTVCSTPIKIVDNDVTLIGDLPYVDSITFMLTGVQNFGEEFLLINPIANLIIYGSGTEKITIVSSQANTFAELENALTNITYINTSSSVIFSQRIITVQLWVNSTSSQLATAIINLFNSLQETQALVNNVSCFGFTDGSINLQPNGGSSPYSISWNGGQTGNFISNLQAGYYYATIQDESGCNRMDTIEVEEPDSLIIDISYSGEVPICSNSSSLLANVEGGTLPYFFAWNNGSLDSMLSELPTGVYIVTITDNNNCFGTASYNLLAGDTMLIIDIFTICEGESLAWNGMSLSTDTLACLVLAQSNGCDSTVCASLTVHPLPTPQIASTGSLCNGQSVSLSVGQYANYQWSSGENLPEILVSMAGDYIVTVTNTFGCMATASTAVLPDVSFEYIVEHPCFGVDDGSIIFGLVNGGAPPFLYSIDSTNFFQTSEFNNLPSGEFWPTIMDAIGCKYVEYVVLDLPLEILLDAGSDVSTLLGVPVALNAATNLSSPTVLWEPADFLDCSTCLNVIATPPFSQKYTLTVSDTNGCEAVDTVAVFVSDGHKYYIPTAFSPNNDGNNDSFTIFSDTSAFSIASLEIFDRWGELVFQTKDIPTNDISRGWKGDLDGETMPADLYVFVIKLLSTDGEETIVRGEVNLIR